MTPFESYVNGLIAIGGNPAPGSMAGFYSWIKELAKPVETVPVDSITLKKSSLRGLGIKACYANAVKVAIANPGVKYVEGYMIPGFLPVPLQHAWNSKDGAYFDITSEIVLREPVGTNTHVAILELDAVDAKRMLDACDPFTVVEWYYRKHVLGR